MYIVIALVADPAELRNVKRAAEKNKNKIKINRTRREKRRAASSMVVIGIGSNKFQSCHETKQSHAFFFFFFMLNFLLILNSFVRSQVINRTQALFGLSNVRLGLLCVKA